MSLLGKNTMLQGRYQIISLLGCGGMGAVYLAQDRRLGLKQVAIKENFDTSPQAQQQFQFEAHILANLDHPNLPQVTDHFIESNGRQYLVMEYVEGEDLESMRQRHPKGQLPERQVLAWADALLDALIYLHTQSNPVIHRDVKPANIKLTPQGKVKLVDFGIAKIYQPGKTTYTAIRASGSPGFAPVEQYTGGTDARSDIYSLGATLYCLLTGEVPPESAALAAGQPLPLPRKVYPSVSQKTDAVILRAMAVNANQRFQTADEMRRILRSGLTRPPTQAPAPQATRKKARPWWLWAGLPAVLMAVLACASAMLVLKAWITPTATPTAVVVTTRGTPAPTHTSVAMTPSDTPAFGSSGTPVPTPNLAATTTAEAQRLAEYVAATLTAEPTSTPTLVSSTAIPTPTPEPTNTPTPATLPDTWEEQEKNDGPTSALDIGLISRGRGVINAVGDEDYYKIATTGEAWLEIEVLARRNNSELDSELVLLDGRGQTIAQSDDALGKDSYLRLILPEAGNYYIVVSEYDNDEGGSNYYYDLILKELPVDNNNTASTADPISYGDVVDGVISITGDQDIYRFEGKAGDLIDVYAAKPEGSELDSYIALHGSDLQELAENDDFFGQASYLRYRLQADGVFYIQVTEYGNDEGGDSHEYQLHLSYVEPDNNDSIATATPIEVDQTISAVIDYLDDLDYFTFTASAGDTVHALVDTSKVDSALDSYLTLLDKDGRELASNDDHQGQDAGIEFQIPEDGIYYLRVEDLGRDKGGFQYRYQLKLLVFPAG